MIFILTVQVMEVKRQHLMMPEKKIASITMDDVNEFFRKNVEIKRKPRGTNSFVAPFNNHTYQIDLFFISKDDIETTQKVRAGLVCIDVLSKYAVVVPH